MKNDELNIYRGEDFFVSNYIQIHQPTLNEIANYGEQEYYSMLYYLTATPQSLKAQLWSIGIDYTEITPFQLFYMLLYKQYAQEQTAILFGELDFTKFQVMQRTDTGEIVLFQVIHDEDVMIDAFTYTLITDHLRNVHDIYKDEKIPANESTKMILIEDSLEELKQGQTKDRHSQLKNLISSMVNSEGFKYDHTQVWNMKINAFMDSVKRISKIKNAELLLQSGYSGFGISLKDIDKTQLNWLGDLG